MTFDLLFYILWAGVMHPCSCHNRCTVSTWVMLLQWNCEESGRGKSEAGQVSGLSNGRREGDSYHLWDGGTSQRQVAAVCQPQLSAAIRSHAASHADPLTAPDSAGFYQVWSVCKEIVFRGFHNRLPFLTMLWYNDGLEHCIVSIMQMH